MKVHPAAEIFPLRVGDHLQELVEDIQANGLLEPIVVLEGQVLDGRNRLRACELADVEPHFQEYTGELDPIEFVRSRNLHRRHLTASQRAAAAALAEDLLEREREKARERQGRRTDLDVPERTSDNELSEVQRSDDRVAQAFGTNRESLRQARKLREREREMGEERRKELGRLAALRQHHGEERVPPEMAEPSDTGEETPRCDKKLSNRRSGAAPTTG